MMLVLSSRATISPVLSLAPYALLGLTTVSSIGHTAWIHLRSKQHQQKRRTIAESTGEENESLLNESETETGGARVDGKRGVVEGPTAYEIGLEGLQVLTVVSLVAISVARIQAGEEKWRRIFDGGILASAVSFSFSPHSLWRLC